MVIGQGFALAILADDDRLGRAVDGRHARVLAQIDVLVGIELLRPKQDAFEGLRTRQIFF